MLCDLLSSFVQDGIFGPCDSCKRTELGAEYTTENSELVAHSQMTLQRVKQLKLEKGESNTPFPAKSAFPLIT